MVENSALRWWTRQARFTLGVLGLAVLGAGFAAPSASEAKARLSGVVWADADRDGIRDAGEGGRGGVRVEILRSARRNSQPTIVGSVRTGGSGAWSAPLGPAGFYRARVLLPGSVEGFSPANKGRDDKLDSDVSPAGPRIGMTPPLKVVDGKPSRRFDAGLLAVVIPSAVPGGGSGGSSPGPPVTIGDFVWRDADADGIQDPAETGVAGIAVELWNPAKNTLLASTTTNLAGYWALPGNAGASYRIRVLAGGDLFSFKSAGASASQDSDINPDGPDAAFSDAFSPGASTIDLDAGLCVAVGDLVWRDANANGIQDPGETGVPGLLVQLWNAAKTSLLASSTTDAAGRYLLAVPGPGSYRVRVIAPGSTFTAKDGGPDTVDSDVNPAGPDSGFTDAFAFPAAVNSSFDAGLL